ncbi:hypothetical protein CUMW_256620 [Citrus unshiu]|uniref:Uncharacterized protein n=1 Tax=Citrus unshiu TaxID=55188 RepID=A0A2H5QS70_CITUN|nr:hypothetical protein CUMW_256620 [Citrus unshiu]
MIVGWAFGFAFAVHVALSWIFVSKLNLGIPGAMSAMIIASCSPISSGVMICLEFWYNALLVLLAGYMKNATIEISSFSICSSSETRSDYSFNLPQGIGLNAAWGSNANHSCWVMSTWKTDWDNEVKKASERTQ